MFTFYVHGSSLGAQALSLGAWVISGCSGMFWVPGCSLGAWALYEFLGYLCVHWRSLWMPGRFLWVPGLCVLPDPLPEPQTASLVSHPQEFSIIPGGRTEVRSPPGRSGRVDGQAGYREGRSHDPWFLQPAVHSPQGRRDLATCLGHFQAEQIRQENQVFLWKRHRQCERPS